MNKKDVLQAVKFTLFSASAGVIQVVADILCNEVIHLTAWISYTIALVLSVIWNFTFNRRFTFKSADNVGLAMLKVAGFYLVFAPLSAAWTAMFVDVLGVNEYIILAVTMIINVVTEFVFCKYEVYLLSEDTNALADKPKKKKDKTEENDELNISNEQKVEEKADEQLEQKLDENSTEINA